jgi:hypothetical protein
MASKKWMARELESEKQAIWIACFISVLPAFVKKYENQVSATTEAGQVADAAIDVWLARWGGQNDGA